MVEIKGIEMSWADAGTLLTICGMVIVFLVLIILIMAIGAFGKMMSTGIKGDSKEKSVLTAPTPVKSAPVAVSALPAQDDGELIAVIAAAVDAIYAGSGKRAVIRNIRPAAGGVRSAWATAGVMQNVRSF